MLGVLADLEAGNITDQQAFDLLADDYAEMDEVEQHAKAAKAAVRTQLDKIVRRLGGKASGSGYEATTVEGSTTVSYDAKAVDSIMAEATRAGDFHTANGLAQARRESARAGYIRIARAKG